MLHLLRTEHHRPGLVTVHLAGRGVGDPQVVPPGGVRVVEHAVADRLERLVAASVARAHASRAATTLDLDALVARATRDVCGPTEEPVELP